MHGGRALKTMTLKLGRVQNYSVKCGTANMLPWLFPLLMMVKSPVRCVDRCEMQETVISFSCESHDFSGGRTTTLSGATESKPIAVVLKSFLCPHLEDMQAEMQQCFSSSSSE